MNPIYCIHCNDARRFTRTVDEVRNITHNLKRALSPYKLSNDREITQWYLRNQRRLHLILNDSKHVPFMCGVCVKVNRHDIINAETELRDELINVCYLFENSDEDLRPLLRKTLLLLAGHYPITYECVRRHYLRCEKTKEENQKG